MPTKIKRICKICNKEFEVENHPSRLERGAIYCSIKCRQIGFTSWIKSLPYKQQPAYKGGRVKRICLSCGKKFIAHRSNVKRGGGKFCSKNCFWVAHKKLREELGGFAKGKHWTHTEDYKKRLSLARTGEKNPMWVNGSSRDRKRQGDTHKNNKWRKAIYNRDNFICQECGVAGTQLNAHHIKFWSKYLKDRFKISNGVALCLNCHKYIHRFERLWERSLNELKIR